MARGKKKLSNRQRLIEIEILGDKYAEIEELAKRDTIKASKVKKKVVDARVIKSEFARNYTDISRAFSEIQYDVYKGQRKHFALGKTSAFDIAHYYTYLTYDPLSLSLGYHTADLRLKQLPIHWLLRRMPIPTFYDFYDQFVKSRSYKFIFRDLCTLQYVRGLARYFDDLVTSGIQDRKKIIIEVRDNYAKGNYASVVYSIIPLIEGLIWYYAKIVHKDGTIIFTSNLKRLVSQDGKEIELNIGNLLRNTKFAEKIDAFFVNYFCDEFYRDRIAILHGRAYSNLNKINCQILLVTFDHILSNLYENLQKRIFRLFDQTFTDDVFRKIQERRLSKDDRKMIVAKMRSMRYSDA